MDQAIKSWQWEWPRNEATSVVLVAVHGSFLVNQMNHLLGVVHRLGVSRHLKLFATIMDTYI